MTETETPFFVILQLEQLYCEICLADNIHNINLNGTELFAILCWTYWKDYFNNL